LYYEFLYNLIHAHQIGKVFGVLKAYSSRVGEGPYVTELKNETGDLIRELGHEYGTTTKRPRRCELNPEEWTVEKKDLHMV